MRNPQIAKWNARYAAGEAGGDEDPTPVLPAAVDGVPPGRALDLGCGAGRHAVWLARRGWQVDAVDGSEAAIGLLLARADRVGCRTRIRTQVADLEADPPEFTITPGTYDLIVDCFFLHRPLFPHIRAGVRPGGRFAAALHVPLPGAAGRHRYVLEPGELAALAAGWGWKLLHGVEREAGNPAAGRGLAVAEIVARRPEDDSVA